MSTTTFLGLGGRDAISARFGRCATGDRDDCDERRCRTAEVQFIMDRAYEGNETRQLALDVGFIPVVPPIKTGLNPWECDREMYTAAMYKA